MTLLSEECLHNKIHISLSYPINYEPCCMESAASIVFNGVIVYLLTYHTVQHGDVS